MPTNGSVAGYEGSVGVYDIIENGYDQLIKVYNDLGATVNNGDVYFLDWKRDADSLSPAVRPTLVACATSAVQRQVVVVNNVQLGKESIADQAFGYVQLRGYCPKVKCAATIAVDDFLQGANGSQAAADDGTTQTADSFGIAVTAVDDPATGYCSAVMFGTTALIG